jgi:hypothetical protein
MQALSLLLLQASGAAAYGWVAGQPGVNSRLFGNSPVVKRQANCPFNADHKGAAPYVAPYTYSGAKNGIPGSQKGGIKVPADGDTAHAYTPPGPNDIRGPCPGLNAAANVSLLQSNLIATPLLTKRSTTSSPTMVSPTSRSWSMPSRTSTM